MKTNLLSFALGCILITTLATTSKDVKELLTIKPATPISVISRAFADDKEGSATRKASDYIKYGVTNGYVLKTVQLTSYYHYTTYALVVMEKY